MKFGEWMWRFLAGAMLIVVGWTIWIIYQLNPSPLIMNAAFEAAAKARANGKQHEKQSSHGVIAAPAAALPEAPKEPPINPEKLRFSDTIAIPVPNAKK
jgi:hypothetical protein